jgi:hypothetical protein
MLQAMEAERDGWPREYTEAGIEATREFFGTAVSRSSRADMGPNPG